MGDALDPEVIKNTQISLGKYIKRPPLSEKLLKKPPFRFLHDIITTVLKTTGFFEGLFDENELISENVKDRDSKILFLNKAISVICLTTGKNLSVKPSKIVAGQEPTKTNELLQCLASALDNNLSSQEAVIKYKESTKTLTKDPLEVTTKKDPNKSLKKNTELKKISSKNDNSTSQIKESKESSIIKKDKEKANDKTRKKDSGSVKNEPRNKTTKPKLVPKQGASETKLQSQNKIIVNDIKSINDSEGTECEKTTELEKIQHNIDKKSEIQNNEILNSNTEVVNTNIDGQDVVTEPVPEVDLKLPLSENIVEIENKNNESIIENSHSALYERNEQLPENLLSIQNNSLAINEDDSQNSKLSNVIMNHPIKSDSLNKEQDSNRTIRSTPTKNESNIPRPVSVRPSSSRPGAPRPKDKFENLITDTESHLLGKVNIIVEHGQNEEEEDSSLVIMDQQENSTTLHNDSQEELTLSMSSNEHGHLVQQILNSQKEFSQVTGKTEIEWQFGAQKAKVAQHEEIEQLRYNIQALTRVTNPLGKLLDHIQEDVEVMRQELQQWSNIYEEVSKEIQKQKTLNENSLLPLQSKLKQLEQDIHEKYEKINDLKVLIHKNSSRIEKLLVNGSVQ